MFATILNADNRSVGVYRRQMSENAAHSLLSCRSPNVPDGRMYVRFDVVLLLLLCALLIVTRCICKEICLFAMWIMSEDKSAPQNNNWFI